MIFNSIHSVALIMPYTTNDQTIPKLIMSTSLKKKILSGDNFIKKLIGENYANCDFNVDLMARKLGISKVYLREIISMRYGTSPHKLIEGYRLEKSLILLEKDLTEYQISKKVGYSSTRSYRRAFKSRFGILPGKYKEIIKSETGNISEYKQKLLEKLWSNVIK